MVEISRDNGDRLVKVLNAFGFESMGVSVDDFLLPNRIVQLGYPPNRIDLLTGIDGVSFDQAFSERVEGKLDGIPVAFISKKLLIQNKRASGQAQDAVDAENLKGPLSGYQDSYWPCRNAS